MAYSGHQVEDGLKGKVSGRGGGQLGMFYARLVRRQCSCGNANGKWRDLRVRTW